MESDDIIEIDRDEYETAKKIPIYTPNITKVTSIDTIDSEDDIDSQNLMRLCFFNNSLFCVDYRNKNIAIISLKTNKLLLFNPNKELKGPAALCIDETKSILYVADYNLFKIFAYKIDYDINHDNIEKSYLLTKINEINTGDINIDSIEIDSIYNFLYVSDTTRNNISNWSLNKCLKINEVKVETPSIMRIKHERLFVTSFTEPDITIKKCNKKQKIITNQSAELVKTKRGANCIFIFNKLTFELLNKISFSNWFNPRGLYIDNKMNIFTIALDIVDKTFTETEYLYIIDSTNNKLLNKFDLCLDNIYDFVVCSKQIICIREEAKPSVLVANFE